MGITRVARRSGAEPSVNRACLSAVLVALLTSACGYQMMHPPKIYSAGCRDPYATLHESLRTDAIEIFYVTDRRAKQESDGSVSYGSERSWSAEYGRAVVRIGDDLSWEEVLRYSTSDERFGGRPKLQVESIAVSGRFPTTPHPYVLEGGRVRYSPELLAERAAVVEQVRREIRDKMSETPRKEVFLFIHGINTDFEYAVMEAAEAWHFFGRQGIPLVYTWPARSGTPFSYAYDRESGEFTIYHLKQTLKLLADVPEIERINILAHSRGTDITVSAVRELVLEARAAGQDPLLRYRIGNLVLLAADLDMEVASQRLVAEALGPAVGRITIYVYESDRALRVSRALFGSRARVGDLHPSKLSEEERELLQKSVNADFVLYEGKIAGQHGHRYFQQNEAVSSDVVLVMRYDRPPGEEHGRPLELLWEPVWVLHDDYVDDLVSAERDRSCAAD